MLAIPTTVGSEQPVAVAIPRTATEHEDYGWGVSLAGAPASAGAC